MLGNTATASLQQRQMGRSCNDTVFSAHVIGERRKRNFVLNKERPARHPITTYRQGHDRGVALLSIVRKMQQSAKPRWRSNPQGWAFSVRLPQDFRSSVLSKLEIHRSCYDAEMRSSKTSPKLGARASGIRPRGLVTRRWRWQKMDLEQKRRSMGPAGRRRRHVGS
ncbi:hypothetical protein VTN96DRAFT_114 [Rasamsonia emersonii]